MTIEEKLKIAIDAAQTFQSENQDLVTIKNLMSEKLKVYKGIINTIMMDKYARTSSFKHIDTTIGEYIQEALLKDKITEDEYMMCPSCGTEFDLDQLKRCYDVVKTEIENRVWREAIKYINNTDMGTLDFEEEGKRKGYIK